MAHLAIKPETLADLGPALAMLRDGEERIVLDGAGSPVAALISLEDLELLEQLEDRFDAAEARRVIAQMEADGDEGIPLAQIKRELGLDSDGL